MSSDDQSDKECPLCMETFDIDDINFYPCNCQYQICRFCWHRIRTNENGLCPACRQSYPEDPVNFQPLSSADVRKIKSEKKQKVQQQKNKVVESRKHLAEFRVLQKNLVYAVGLSQRMADPELLKKAEFFGKFGKIIKIAVGAAPAINSAQPAVHTAYITFTRSEDALRAIHAVNNMVVEGRFLKASLGTTKYCSNFLKGQACHKPECMYLHDVAEEEISFTKEDMHQGKHTEYERRLHEQMGSSPGSGGAWGGGAVGGSSNSNNNQNSGTKQQQKLSPLQQQNSFGSGRELAAMRNRAAGGGAGRKQIDKKRGATGSGSLENLPAIANERSRSGTTPVLLTKCSKNTSGASIHSATEAVVHADDVVAFAPFAFADSSSKRVERKQNVVATHGVEDGSSVESLSAAASERCRSGVTTPVTIVKRCNSANCTSDDGEHDDDLGFDPFAESSKALEEIIEEEKNYTPPAPIGVSSSRLHNGTICASGSHHHHHSSAAHFFPGSNNFFGHDANHLLTASHNNGLAPPPGLHHPSPFTGHNQTHQSQQQTNAFSSIYHPGVGHANTVPPLSAAAQFHHHTHNGPGSMMATAFHQPTLSSFPPSAAAVAAPNSSNNIQQQQNNNSQQQHHYPSQQQHFHPHHFGGSIGMGHNSLGDLSETLKGSTAFSTNPQQHPFGGIGIGHNSLSDLRESFKALLPNVNVRFMSDAASNGQLQPQQQQQKQQRYSGGGSTFFEAVRNAAEEGQQQQQQQQTPPSWLPVPPGFSPLFPSTNSSGINTTTNNSNKKSN